MDVSGAPPECPDCATPLQAEGTTAHPYWMCPHCRVARLMVQFGRPAEAPGEGPHQRPDSVSAR